MKKNGDPPLAKKRKFKGNADTVKGFYTDDIAKTQ